MNSYLLKINPRAVRLAVLRTCILLVGLMSALLIEQTAFAQVDGPGIPVDGGGVGGDDGIDGPPGDTGAPPNQVFGGGGGGGAATDSGDTVDIEDAATLNLGGTTEDNRNQGFIGATAPGVSDRNFVGASSQTFGQLADGATFGGGVNDGSTVQIPGVNGGGGAGGFRGVGGGFGGQNTGNIIRRNLRTRLRPSFFAPQVPAHVTVQRFNSNFSRQSGTANLVGRYQVTVENRTAVLTGTVSSRAEADRLERQLRLQPGIYRIVNNLIITN